MKIKIMKDKKKQTIEVPNRLDDLQNKCRNLRVKGYTIIKIIYN